MCWNICSPGQCVKEMFVTSKVWENKSKAVPLILGYVESEAGLQWQHILFMLDVSE